jgi:hypothetical protein
MAASAPSKNTPAGPALRVPPEPEFWKHYSPHGEMPISAAGSVAMHILIVGTLLLFGAYLARLFIRPGRSLPIEAVRLDLGGGGGKPGGVGNKPGIGEAPFEDDTGKPSDETQEGKVDVPDTPALTKVEKAEAKKNLDPESFRFARARDTDPVRKWVRLDDTMRRKTRDGLTPGKGEGGPGSGGGKGKGKGTGEGDASGKGTGTMTQRERRMLRWNMHFPTSNPQDYVRQLNGLGAILAIPLDDSPTPNYKVVRDLMARPAKLLDEDLSEIKRIYWIDDNPTNVRDVMETLGISLRPPRFVAFMPVSLEKKLFDMEKEHMIKKYGSFDEERLYETRFRVVPGSGGKYEPVLMSMKLKAAGQP